MNGSQSGNSAGKERMTAGGKGATGSQGNHNRRQPGRGSSGSQNRPARKGAAPTSSVKGSQTNARVQKPKTSARALAVKVLSAVEQDGAYSNLELNRRLKEAELSKTDYRQ